MSVSDCTKCIMEHSDGLVFIEPTIYIIEGNFYGHIPPYINDDKDERKPECREEDELPF